MRYLAGIVTVAILILLNGCGGIMMKTTHFSKNVDISPSAPKSNLIKLVKEGEKVPFDYYEIGTIYTEGYPRGSSTYNDSFMLPFLADAANRTDADAVIGVHVSKFLPVFKERGAHSGVKDYAAGVLVKYTVEDIDENAVNDNFIDILPMGNPEGVSSENPYVKDGELVVYLAQQYVERNGYYARLIEGSLTINNMHDAGKVRVDNLGNPNSKYLLYLWPAIIELKEDGETTKVSVLKSVLINKKSGEIVWKSEPIWGSEPNPSMYVGANDAQFAYSATRSFGFGKVRFHRASKLRRVVEKFYAEFKPNYKVLNYQQ